MLRTVALTIVTFLLCESLAIADQRLDETLTWTLHQIPVSAAVWKETFPNPLGAPQWGSPYFSAVLLRSGNVESYTIVQSQLFSVDPGTRSTSYYFVLIQEDGQSPLEVIPASGASVTDTGC